MDHVRRDADNRETHTDYSCGTGDLSQLPRERQKEQRAAANHQQNVEGLRLEGQQIIAVDLMRHLLHTIPAEPRSDNVAGKGLSREVLLLYVQPDPHIRGDGTGVDDETIRGKGSVPFSAFYTFPLMRHVHGVTFCFVNSENRVFSTTLCHAPVLPAARGENCRYPANPAGNAANWKNSPTDFIII
jgi:hypothetical protein